MAFNLGAHAILMLVLAALVVPAMARVVNEEGCPEADFAYPFQSVCQEPATFDTAYHLVAPFSNAAVAKGGLMAEDSDDGLAGLVRFTGNASDEGANYVLTPVDASTVGSNITLGTAFTLTNSETNRVLGWKFMAWQRGDLLAELEGNSSAAQFVLQTACNVPLPCPETTGARCESYFFVAATDNTTGFLATNYLNMGMAFVTRISGNTGDLPLLLRRVDESDFNRQHLRQVVNV